MSVTMLCVLAQVWCVGQHCYIPDKGFSDAYNISILVQDTDLHIVAGIESRYARDAKSEVAYGLFQITEVAQLHMNRLHNIKLDRFNVVDNTTLGVLYWRWLRGIHGDDIVRMLAAFNWGPTNVAGVITPNTTGLDLTLLPQETRDYINTSNTTNLGNLKRKDLST